MEYYWKLGCFDGLAFLSIKGDIPLSSTFERFPKFTCKEIFPRYGNSSQLLLYNDVFWLTY